MSELETAPNDDEFDEFDDEMMLLPSGAARWTLLIIGTISVILGVIGLLLPIMPTTPFLIVAAACYARSSRKFYVWLVTNRWFGQQIRDWRAGKGIPLKSKIAATVVIAATFGTSIAVFVPYIWLKITMVVIATAVLIYIWRMPTNRESEAGVDEQSVADQ